MRTGCRLLAGATLAFAAAAAPAATYLPISDAELALRSPVIVRGRVLDQTARLERIDGKDLPFTITTVQVLETLKGHVAGGTVRLRLPGGRSGGLAWSIPGTPTFSANQEVLLLMRPADRSGEFHLSEFGLSRFDLVQDEKGRRFAARPAFDAEEDLYLSKRAVTVREHAPGGRPTPLRDAESLLGALRAASQGETMPDVQYAEPAGALSQPAVPSLKPEWVNIGGPEPGNGCGSTPCLFRWFWDTGNSPNAVVSVSGTQSLLSDSSNGITHVQNGVDQWHTGVPSTDIRISGVTGGGNIAVNLDAASSHDGGSAWSTPLACTTGGTIGLGGPGSSPGPRTFKGDTSYFSPNSGTVSMRQRTGSPLCYSAASFRTGVMHEIGHVLGLGHPDQAQSTHSTTSSADWATAVMTSSVPASKPSTPQTDDIQAMQYYYGTGTAACVANATTLCLNNNRFKVTAAWDSVNPTQSGQGTAIVLTTDTGYFWFFNSTNVEVVIKVLNACGVNLKYWVFAAGLTNVHVVLTVTDLQTGTTKIYTNPQGVKYDAVQDTSAFSTCP